MVIMEITKVKVETTIQATTSGLHIQDSTMSMTGNMLTKVNITKEMPHI